MKQYKFKINGNEYNVEINSVEGNMADVTVNGTTYNVELDNAPTVPALNVPTAPVTPAPAAQPAAAPVPKPSTGAGKDVKSPLPGVIVSVNVTVGDTVKTGQVVAVLEAMKMENEIQAEFDGTVTAVKVAKGDSILEGASIVTIG